jgi:hypothetical protein
MRIESKHKHIEDAQERNIIISQEYEDFMEDYGCIVYGRPIPLGIQRQQECVGWNPQENVLGEHIHK